MQSSPDGPIAWLTAWLSRSALSRLLQDVEWLVPAIQTIHILAVALLASSVVLLTLAVFGRYGREQPLTRAATRFGTAIRVALPVLLASGALMITAEPGRALPNPAFQLKMALVVAAAALTGVGVRHLARAGAPAAPPGIALRAAASLALALWLGALVAGRWIAYTLAH